MPDAVHPAAASGFDAEAESYERARPAYPGAVSDVLAGCAGPVVDLAAGTGKLTASLASAGHVPIAIEPVAGMLRVMRRVRPHPALRAVAEFLPLRSSSIGTVAVGQAFHWFDTARALTEIRRVLVDGGRLVLVFNERDESVEWVARFTEICVRRGGGRPYTPHNEHSWPSLLSDSGFVDVTESMNSNPIVTDLEGLVDRAASTSYVAALDEAAKNEALAEVRHFASVHPDLAGEAVFEFPHTTQLVVGVVSGR